MLVHVLLPAEAVRLAAEHRVPYDAATVTSWLRPGWRLLPSGEERPGASKIGGHPDLTVEEVWPRNPRGVALAFLAQLNCSELPEFDAPWKLLAPWAHGDNVIRLFADLLDDPVDPVPAIGLQAAADAAFRRTPAPPVPDPFPPGGPWDDYEPRDYLYVLPETFVRAVPFVTAHRVRLLESEVRPARS